MAKEKEQIITNENGERIIYRDKPKKRNPFLIGCGGLLLLCILLGACMSMFGGTKENDAEKSNTSNTAEKKDEKQKSYKIGDTVKVGKMQYKVNDVTTTDQITANGINEKAKGTYQVVDITVKNNGDDSITVDSELFKLKVDGKTLSADTSASMFANEANNSFFMEQLNPDSELTGKVVFDVSKSLIDKDKELEVATGFFGTEKGLIDLK